PIAPRGAPRCFELVCCDLEGRELIEIQRRLAERSKFVVQVMLVVSEHAPVVIDLHLSHRVSVGAGLEVPDGLAPVVVLVALALIPATAVVAKSGHSATLANKRKHAPPISADLIRD